MGWAFRIAAATIALAAASCNFLSTPGEDQCGGWSGCGDGFVCCHTDYWSDRACVPPTECRSGNPCTPLPGTESGCTEGQTCCMSDRSADFVCDWPEHCRESLGGERCDELLPCAYELECRENVCVCEPSCEPDVTVCWNSSVRCEYTCCGEGERCAGGDCEAID